MCFAASMGHAQIANMEYVAVKNTDVAAHIAAEKNIFSKAHKEQVDKGNKLDWDMWMIENNSLATLILPLFMCTSISLELL